MAVIGCGDMGKRHARALSRMDDVDLVAVCDKSDIRADALSEELGCDPVYEYYDLWGEVDAAVVATDAHSHREVAVDLMENGIHVLVEKPMAVSMLQAEEMDDRAKENDVVLQVGHIERFNPVVGRVIDVVRSKGPPFHVEAERLGVSGFRLFDVDVILDLMIHDIDILRSMSHSRVRRVTATGVWDCALAEIEMEDGSTATFRADRKAKTRARRWSINDETHFIITDHDCLHDELRHFIGCAKDGKRPGCDQDKDSLWLALGASWQIRGET
jgi:predicted dehydrogenase